MGDFRDAFVKLFEAMERPEQREKDARRALRSALRSLVHAIALEQEENRCIEARDALDERDLPAEAKAAAARQALVHRSRCEHLSELAKCLEIVMRSALGSLRVEESTVGTGLRTADRALIDAVASLGVEE